MSAFYVLLTEESAQWLGNNIGKRETKGRPRIFSVYNLPKMHGREIITRRANVLYDPNKQFTSWDDTDQA